MILNFGLEPPKASKAFSQVFRSILQKRLKAKRAGDKVAADRLKITVNGTFGKLGSCWSFLYAPPLLHAVTFNGQLQLLMLIERIAEAGIAVHSANTDGIVCRVPKAKAGAYARIVEGWCKECRLKADSEVYEWFGIGDVNNYVALKRGDGDPWDRISAKGRYKCEPFDIAHSPVAPVCAWSVQNFLIGAKEGVQAAIRRRAGPTSALYDFCIVARVRGAGMSLAGSKVGRVARFYWSKSSADHLVRNDNGYKVPRSDNCRLVQRQAMLPRTARPRGSIKAGRATSICAATSLTPIPCLRAQACSICCEVVLWVESMK